MGLAASQARLLTITARKADCEFQSMALSHQKLALSRSMETVSSDYQNALNSTKLVYDYQSTGDSDMALTYGLLMSPSIYNDYYPKLLTDSKNRVILDSSYAAAARAAGIPAEGLTGTPSSDVRNKFIEALAGENIITPLQATSIEGVAYSNTIGNGDTIGVSTATTDVTYDELLDLIKANCESSSDYGLSLGGSSNVSSASSKPQRLIIKTSDTTTSTVMNSSSGYALTLADLLEDKAQYVLAYEARGDESSYYNDALTPIYTALDLQTDIVGENGTDGILSWINDQFATILGGTTASDTALSYAYNAVYNLYYPSNNLVTACNNHNTSSTAPLEEIGTKVNTDKEVSTSFQEKYATESIQYLGITYEQGKRHSGKRSWNCSSTVGVSLNNIADAFLTAYVQYMQGIGDSEYSIQKGKISDANSGISLYNGLTDDFNFSVVTDTTIDDSDSQLYANFYDTLFNRICLNGWVENEQIDDADYMTELLKSGMAYISSISDDGYYYQSNYSTDPNISEVTDDEAIAKAEAKYNTEKAKIENKEDTIDLKMKNLDTEISSLTTEYESTKQVITKAIEKSFKRYDA
jgi:hypothetical protein